MSPFPGQQYSPNMQPFSQPEDLQPLNPPAGFDLHQSNNPQNFLHPESQLVRHKLPMHQRQAFVKTGWVDEKTRTLSRACLYLCFCWLLNCIILISFRHHPLPAIPYQRAFADLQNNNFFLREDPVNAKVCHV